MGRKANQQRQTLIVLAAVGAGLMLACVAGAGFVALTALVPAKKPAKVYEREELRKLLHDKTEQEVLKALGPPYSRNGTETEWTYKEIAYDKINGKVDYLAVVHFRAGRVVSVAY